METVTHTSTGLAIIVSLLPVIFLVVSVIIIILVVRYFIRLGNDVKVIRQRLEERKDQDQ